MAGFLDDMDSSSDDDLAWPAAGAAEPAPAAPPAAAPPAAAPAAAPAPGHATASQREQRQPPAPAAAVQSLQSAWVPPPLRPVRDAALSRDEHSTTGSSAVGRLDGLRTGTDWPACAAGWCPQPPTSVFDQPASMILAVGTYRLEEVAPPAAEPEPEPEPGPAQAHGADTSEGDADGGGLRDADPEERERQRRQQQRTGTIRLYQLAVKPPAPPPPAAAGAATVVEPEPEPDSEGEEVRRWQPITAALHDRMDDERHHSGSVTRLAAGALDIKWCPWRPRSIPGAAEEADSPGAPPLLGVACADGSVRLLRVRKRHFLSTSYIQTIILPRRAWDKHRENSTKYRFLAAARG
jgi:hypothetical protein